MVVDRDALEAAILSREWFYPMVLPSGRPTRCYLPEAVRPLHASRARMLATVEELRPESLGRFDLVVLFGLLYHSPHPWLVLERAAGLTRQICCIETQLAADPPATMQWGSKLFEKSVHGCLAIVDESDELAARNREASIHRRSLVPSERAVRHLCEQSGFASLERLDPPAGAHEQLVSGARALFVARR